MYGTFELPVSKATRSHHFSVLRAAGLIEQRDDGPRRLNRLRREEFDHAFPGLLGLVLRDKAQDRKPARGWRAGRADDFYGPRSHSSSPGAAPTATE